jgi:hypothetical protein
MSALKHDYLKDESPSKAHAFAMYVPLVEISKSRLSATMPFSEYLLKKRDLMFDAVMQGFRS